MSLNVMITVLLVFVLHILVDLSTLGIESRDLSTPGVDCVNLSTSVIDCSDISTLGIDCRVTPTVMKDQSGLSTAFGLGEFTNDIASDSDVSVDLGLPSTVTPTGKDLSDQGIALGLDETGSRAIVVHTNDGIQIPFGVRALVAAVCIDEVIVEVYSDCILGTCTCTHMIGPVVSQLRPCRVAAEYVIYPGELLVN